MSELLAAIEFKGELIATGKTTSKKNRLTFQEWVRRGIIRGDFVELDQLVELYKRLGGGVPSTFYPFEKKGWIRSGAFFIPSDAPKLKILKSKFLWYEEAHRFILVSTPYKPEYQEVMRVDTHFSKGRIYFPRIMGKEELLKIYDGIVNRSRSKTYCWAMSLLFGLYWGLQENSQGSEMEFPRDEEE